MHIVLYCTTKYLYSARTGVPAGAAIPTRHYQHRVDQLAGSMIRLLWIQPKLKGNNYQSSASQKWIAKHAKQGVQRPRVAQTLRSVKNRGVTE